MDHLSKRPIGIVVVAVLAIVFGLGEVFVGLRGNYLGILSNPMNPSVATAVVGLFYVLGGASLLITRRRWGAIAAIGFIGAEVLGRIVLVVLGIAPSTGADFLKIIVGGLIAIGFMIYIAWRCLRP